MASWMHISVCIIAALVVNTVFGAQITTTPSNQITIGGENPTSQLRIVCRASSSFQVVSLELGKKSQAGETSAIVQILTGGEVQVVDTSLQQRMTYTGSISGTTGSLEITLSDLQCSDAASTYYCSEQYNNAGFKTVEATNNITARTYPGPITMLPRPDSSVYANPPVSVEFLCTGEIGNQFDQNMNMANYWVWEWRYLDDINSPWVRYPDTNNITYRAPTPTSSNGCQYNGGSSLFHTVRTIDNGRQFRCYVINPEYGNNKTVYTQNPGVTGQPDTVEGGPQGANVGMIVGIVIGVLAVIVIVVVLVYFLVFRRKSGGDDYDTGEGKEDRPPMTGNVVYSTPASREKRGYDKKDSNANAEGLHYADLDLTKLPMNEDPDVRPKDTPTEYASIKLFP